MLKGSNAYKFDMYVLFTSHLKMSMIPGSSRHTYHVNILYLPAWCSYQGFLFVVHQSWWWPWHICADDWKDQSESGIEGRCRALWGRHNIGFVLLPLQHGTGPSALLTENCTLLDFSSQGWSFHGYVLPVVQVGLKALGGFKGVLVSLFGASLCSFSPFQLTTKDLFWQSCAAHSDHLASPSAGLLQARWDAGKLTLLRTLVTGTLSFHEILSSFLRWLRWSWFDFLAWRS